MVRSNGDRPAALPDLRRTRTQAIAIQFRNLGIIDGTEFESVGAMIPASSIGQGIG